VSGAVAATKWAPRLGNLASILSTLSHWCPCLSSSDLKWRSETAHTPVSLTLLIMPSAISHNPSEVSSV
jgi:hypothetical protein